MAERNSSIPANRVTRTQAAASNAPAAEPRRSINYVKWGLGCTGIGMILFTGATLFALILAPVVFRNMLPEQQQIWMHRFPFLEAFKPTRIYQGNTIPTASVNEAAALALLTDGGSMTVPASIGLVATPTALPSNTPTRAAPTSVLATNTPVMSTVEPSPTVPPSATPLPSPTFALPTLSPTDVPVPPSTWVSNIKFIQQTWNNCGPANVTQVLRKFGWRGNQDEAAGYLKPFREDKNVSPWQIVNYVNNNTDALGVRALFRVGGTTRLLKALMAADFGVIIEKGHDIVGQGWMGHYLTMEGYDDARQLFFGMDTNLGPGADGRGRPFPYDELDNRWRQFNRIFIVIYPVDRERDVAGILGPYVDDLWAIGTALNMARQEASSYPDNSFTWFNLGSSFTLLGDFSKAAVAFDKSRALNTTPFRMLWYQFGPFEAYYNVGRYGDVIELARTAITSTQSGYGLEESFYWQGMAYAAQGMAKEAEAAFNEALANNPNFYPASEQLASLRNGTFKPPQIAQK